MQAIYQWLMTSNEPFQIAAQFREANSSKVDWDYFDEVFLRIPACQESIEEKLNSVIDRDIDALDMIEKALLYIGVFELTNLPDIPYSVVINECVELAKTFGASDSHKYVNGVLDKLAKKFRPDEMQTNS
tara:strand:- start:318 stop:707 length:390 start_codon:yes stop_codon:yes gene_type:complete